MMQELVKPIVGVLTSDTGLMEEILMELARFFGPHDVIGQWVKFDYTNYYANEMGDGLNRTFVSFEKLLPPYRALELKSYAKEVESKFSVDNKRKVNVDPGYLDANKVVLITGKHGGHKIALGEGVWADFLLWYNKGWVALPWAFPDFRDGSHFDTFMKMRRKFKQHAHPWPL